MYHLHVGFIERSKGRSAVACAAYRAGENLYDDRCGLRHDYTARRGILRSEILAPDNAPTWVFRREELWNHAEACENRRDARIAREIELSLPHEVPPAIRVEMVEQFIRQELLPLGMVVDYAIHAPNRKGDQRNYHAHLLTTLRPLEDDHFSRIKDRDSCRPEALCKWRESWAEIVNETYERLQLRDDQGRLLTTDHRSYEDRGIDQVPTQHMGPHATELERQGIATDIGDKNRDIRQSNIERQRLRRELTEIDRELEGYNRLRSQRRKQDWDRDR